jgi:flagellar biosynthesis protein FlhF
MNVKKFHARSSREALQQVKQELGPDAVILSNRRVQDGVELMALAGADMASLVAEHTGAARTAKLSEAMSHRDDSRTPASANDSACGRVPMETLIEKLRNEIHSVRGALEAQIAMLAWTERLRRDPAKSGIMRTLLCAGFSPLLARQVAEHFPGGSDGEEWLNWARAVLERNIRTAEADEIVARGGVYALVGPTGVGKTTTVAKIAARCVVRYGAENLALLTTDSYRIGGHEQLRIYGKLLGVPVRAVKDPTDLQLALSELRGKHLILIDTVGMSQRDRMVSEQTEMLTKGSPDVKHLLLLSAAGSGETLDDVVKAYRCDGLYGSIITKVDEAASLGGVLDAVIRHRLVLHYVANGQKVPEDLHTANAAYLLHRALQPPVQTSPFAFRDDETVLMVVARRAETSERTSCNAAGSPTAFVHA